LGGRLFVSAFEAPGVTAKDARLNAPDAFSQSLRLWFEKIIINSICNKIEFKIAQKYIFFKAI
jgi:hypothetical protein